VGAGREPGVAASHPPRPPIPIQPFHDEAAWLAGSLGANARVVEREVVAVRPGPNPPLEVPEVAAAVDEGRAAAAAFAADGVTVLIGTGGAPAPGERVLEQLETSEHGPLGVLRRFGDAETAFLCGLALGAGEQGLAYAADGPAAHAGARVAIAIEPDLAPRVRFRA
jgi:hypothetical protein